MRKIKVKILALLLLTIIVISNILPVAYAISDELINVTEENITETQENVITDNFDVLLAGILKSSEDVLTFENTQEIISQKQINGKGLWIKEESRDYLMALFNSVSNKNYIINSDGFLVVDENNIKNEEEIEEKRNFYTIKFDEMINSEKCIIVSIEETYKNLNTYDNEILDMIIENDEYALLFTDDNFEVIVLNQINYNSENLTDSNFELVTSILETLYHDDSNFVSNIETYSLNNTNAIQTEEVENMNIINSDNISMSQNVNIVEDNTFETILSDFTFNTVESVENININSNENTGILIDNASKEIFLEYLNNHGIYTYSTNEQGYLVSDGIMKENQNLDFVDVTEVDLEISNILSQDIKIYIKVDNKYLSETGEETNYIFLADDEYVKTFDNNTGTERIAILNSNYFIADMGYNVELSDRFVKKILDYDYDVELLSDTSKYGYMTEASSVYFGPSSSDYASVGSVDKDEKVYLLGQSVGWYHIQYLVGSTGKQKSGYVPVSSVTNIVADPAVHEEILTGGYRYANDKITIYSCDDLDIAVSVGTVFAGEGVTLIYKYTYSDSGKSYNISLVEYSTSSGTKRGYTYTSNLSAPDYPTSVARVTSTNPAYSGPDTSYVKLGGAYYNEYVSIIAKEGNWVLVEYNTTSGRKRGFMSYSNLNNCNYPTGGYVNFPTATATELKKATQEITVYGGPNSNYASIGTVFNQEIVTYLSSERGYAYIEYSTSNGAKRGYVNINYLETTTAPSLPIIPEYTNFTSGTYGLSGLETPLKYYKIGNGVNVAFIVFSQHGWEDAWASDGIELVNIANQMMNSLSTIGISNNWTLYVIPYANPDGITNGYTNNGPGRCTVTTKTDMNRSWPANFVPNYTSRNYTGDTSLNSPELIALKSFIESNIGNENKIIIDVHGWLNKTYGDYEIAKYFDEQFDFSHSSTFGSGYLETWAHSIGAKSTLVELPFPTSAESITTDDYAGKMTNAVKNLLNNYGIPIEEGGTEVLETVEVVSPTGSLNVRSGPGTNYSILATLTSGSLVTRIRTAVATANGYTWDKIQLSDGAIGYVATNYLNIIQENTLSEEETKIVKAYCRYYAINDFSGNIDSTYDNDIILTIKEFQRINELTQTGYVDTDTWNAMELNDINTYELYKKMASNYINYNNPYGPSYYNVKDSKLNSQFQIGRKTADIEQAANWQEKAALYDSMSPEEKANKAIDLTTTKLELETLAVAGNFLFPMFSIGLTHYLNNTGDLKILDADEVKTFMEKSEKRKTDILDKYTTEAQNAIEYMLTIDKTADFSLVNSIPVALNKTSEPDWFLFINGFYFSLEGQCFKKDNIYTAVMNYYVRDYYDFDTVEGWEEKLLVLLNNGIIDGMDDVLLTDVADLHYAGMAQFYYIEGFYTEDFYCVK